MPTTKKTTTTQSYQTGSGVKTTTTPAKTTTPSKTTTNSSAAQKAAADLAKTQGQLNTLLSQLGTSIGSTGTTGGRSDASYAAEGRSGTSTTGQHYIEGKPVSNEEFNNWLYGGANQSVSSNGTDLQAQYLADQQKAQRQSAYDLLAQEFTQYGLGSLVEPLKALVQENVSPSEFAIRLQQTDAYKQRFSANADRIAKGLTALKPAEYIAMEDQYQNIMRNYGLPATYYTKDATGKQAGFDKLLANDVSQAELEDRVATAQQRVINSNPEVLQALKQFYPDISNADILAYTLDPQNALTNIKRKVTAAEIGGAALAQGLQAQGGTAESLAGQGITKAQAQQGYTDIANILPRASQLSEIYNQGPYDQATAEAEVFNTTGAAQAAAKRKKLTSLETAAFSGQSGVGSLGRDRSLYGQAYGQSGQY